MARALAARGMDAVASLAGGGREGPRPDAGFPLPLRRGGFGGAEGFCRYLDEQRITAVIDATHPFAARITARTAAICAARDLSYCLLQRPPWHAEPGDLWTEIPGEAAAARHIAPGSTVFLATGRRTLGDYANLAGCRLICRQIGGGTGEFPFPNGRFLSGTPPFSVAHETRLFTELGVDWLVLRNAGGAGPATKLVAARALGIRVAMIARPPLPDGVMPVASVAEALVRVGAP